MTAFLVPAYHEPPPQWGRELSSREAVLPLKYLVREDGLQSVRALPKHDIDYMGSEEHCAGQSQGDFDKCGQRWRGSSGVRTVAKRLRESARKKARNQARHFLPRDSPALD